MLKGYVSRQYLGEWLHHNYAAGRFNTKKLCSKRHSIEIEFYSKIIK